MRSMSGFLITFAVLCLAFASELNVRAAKRERKRRREQREDVQ